LNHTHTPAVYFYRRYEFTADSFNLSTTWYTTFHIGHKHPPSIFTLRDFVAAFAGLFLRRLCSACEARMSGSTEPRAVL